MSALTLLVVDMMFGGMADVEYTPGADLIGSGSADVLFISV